MIELSKTKYGVVKYPEKLVQPIMDSMYARVLGFYKNNPTITNLDPDDFQDLLEKFAKKLKVKIDTSKSFFYFNLKKDHLPTNYTNFLEKEGKKFPDRIYVNAETPKYIHSPHVTKDSDVNTGNVLKNMYRDKASGAYSEKTKQLYFRCPEIQGVLFSLIYDMEKAFWPNANTVIQRRSKDIDYAMKIDRETIEHELRHWVQDNILHPKQSKVRNDYRKSKKGYLLSPAEFGPSLNTRINMFVTVLVEHIERAAKKSLYLDKKDVDKILDLYLQKKEPDFAFESKLLKDREVYNFVMHPDFSPFVIYKDHKPTAYTKALKHFEKVFRPKVYEAIEKRLKELK